jgi:hypothetical protein
LVKEALKPVEVLSGIGVREVECRLVELGQRSPVVVLARCRSAFASRWLT